MYGNNLSRLSPTCLLLETNTWITREPYVYSLSLCTIPIEKENSTWSSPMVNTHLRVIPDRMTPINPHLTTHCQTPLPRRKHQNIIKNLTQIPTDTPLQFHWRHSLETHLTLHPWDAKKKKTKICGPPHIFKYPHAILTIYFNWNNRSPIPNPNVCVDICPTLGIHTTGWLPTCHKLIQANTPHGTLWVTIDETWIQSHVWLTPNVP